jgi:protoporphyrinogen oxidase
VRDAAARLRCTHLYYLDMALAEPCGVPYNWVYVPEEAYPFYRVGCYSSFSEKMAPPGKANLYVELVDRAEPDLDELLPRVSRHLVAMGILRSPAAVAFARLRRIDHAYVIYDHHHDAALATILPFLRAHRIVSAGRYGGWNYSSMSDAIRFGRDAAAEVASWLRGAP